MKVYKVKNYDEMSKKAASVLQLHKNVTIIADEAALSRMQSA